MRRNKRVRTVELPRKDPVRKVISVTPGIPVEIPRLEPAQIPNAPKKQDVEVNR
jgi:hypothetical protein